MLRSFSKLLSFSLLASIINFASSFVLAYVYDPLQFGEFSLFFAIANIISGFLFLRADFLIAKRKELEKYAYSLLFYSVSILTFILLFLSLLYCDFLQVLLVVIWGAGISLNSLVTYMCINRGGNTLIGYIRVSNAVAISILQLAFCDLNYFNGLILGSVIAVVFINLIPFFILRKNRFKLLDLSSSLLILKRNVKYLLPSTISWLFDAVLLSIFPVLINFNFGPVVAGYYVFADRIIKSPMSVLTSTISPIFVRYISEENDYKCIENKLIIYATVISILSFCFFCFGSSYIEMLVIYLWGNKWAESATIIGGIIMYYFSYMYNISTMYIYHYFRKVNIYIILQFSYILFTLCVFYIMKFNWKETINVLFLSYTVVFIINVIIQIFILRRMSNEKKC